MTSPKEALLAVHSRALTGHDVETILGHARADVRCVCDGNYVGEGHDVLRKFLEAEYAGADGMVARVADADGEPVVIEYDLVGGERKPRAVVRIDNDAHRVAACRIDHDAELVARLAGSGRVR